LSLIIFPKFDSLKENISLIINFSDKKLLINIMTNLYSNFYKIKKMLVTKIVTIINKQL